MAEQTPSAPENPFANFTAAHWGWVGVLTTVGIVAFHEAWYWSLLGSTGIVYGFAKTRPATSGELSRTAPSAPPSAEAPHPSDQTPTSKSEHVDTTVPAPVPLAQPQTAESPAGALHATWYDENGKPLSATPTERFERNVPITRAGTKEPLSSVKSATEAVDAQSAPTLGKIVAAAVVAVLVYVAYSAILPYWATYRLYKAIQQRDTVGLERVVAFDDLRANLKRKMGDASGVAVDALVTPSAIIAAIGNRAPDSSDDRAVLFYAFASGHRDGDGHFVVADMVVFCRYGLRWRVCDLKGS